MRTIIQLNLMAVLLGMLIPVALGAPSAKGRGAPKGDWPMTRGGPWRANRASVACDIKSEPELAWRYPIGSLPGAIFSADLDNDGHNETYAIVNWRLVRSDAQGKEVWRSERITRQATLLAYDDLDGDGKREPLMAGSGLNESAPLYFVFDPHTGAIRWQAELAPTNGGDTRCGKIDTSRNGLQLVRALFPNPGGGELHMFCWDRGIEQGYSLWSWQRWSDFIYFPQLVAGDVNRDGQNEILMLSQMCVWAFDSQLGNEIARITWGKRWRSYGGQFGLWQMTPGSRPSIVVVSAYNKVTVIDIEVSPVADGAAPSYIRGTNNYRPPRDCPPVDCPRRVQSRFSCGKPGQSPVKLTLRWDHEFEPGVPDEQLKGGYGTGNPGFLPDSVCDVDGDGWGEVVVSESAAYPDEAWHVVVLGARDGRVMSEMPGKVIVGAADIDGDGKAEVFLRNRVHKHDPVSGPVQVARWRPGKGLVRVWTAPVEGDLMREPNDPSLHLWRHPDEGTRVKLAPGSGPGVKAFFIQSPDGRRAAYEAEAGGFKSVELQPPLDRALPIANLGAAPSRPLEPSLAVDFDGDGRNEVVQRTSSGAYVVLKPPAPGAADAKVIARIEGALQAPTFADLDGDGKVEVIAVRMGDSLGPEGKQQPCLEVTRTDGSLVWRKAWPADFVNKYTLAAGGFAIMYVAVGHFTGRNPLDVAVSFTGERSKGNTAVLEGTTGATVWSITSLYPGMYGECWDANPPIVFDYDGDGLDDLATTCQTVHYTVLRGKDGSQLLPRPRDASNQGFGGEQALFPGAWATGPLLGAGDADGDGRPELGVFFSQAAVGALRPGGEPLWFLNLPIVKRVPSPGCWADVNGDGKDEAAFIFKDGYLRIYDGITGALRWEENLGAAGAIVAADVDGDGADEILFGSEKGTLCCLGEKADAATGSHIRWVKQFAGTPAQAIVADLDGDGIGEILVPTSDGYLNCLAGPRRRDSR